MESLRGKLVASFMAVISVLVIAGGSFVIANFMIISRYENIMDNMVSEYELISKTEDVVNSFNNLIKYIRSQERMDAFITSRKELRDLLDKLDVSIDDQNSFAVYVGLRHTISLLIADAEKGIEAVSGGRYVEINKYYESVNTKKIFVTENTNTLILTQLEYLENLQKEILSLQRLIQLFAVIIFLLIVLSSVIYVIRFSKNLIKPLDKLTKLARTISSGNLDAPMSVDLLKSNDEISSLAESFAKMLSYLKDNISKLQEYNTEIKDSRNKIRAEKKKLQQYLDVAGVFVITFDFNNLIIMVNKKGQEMLGISEDDSVGRDWVETYVSKKDRIKTRSLLNFFSGEISPINTLENSLVGTDGKEKNIVWHFSILKDDKGQGRSILGTGVDVTELSQAKITISQLKEVDRLKNEVLNIATHELKTPLISIVGLSEVMKNNPKTIPDDYKEYINIINNEGEKLNHLIKSMLTVSRNELGKTIVNKETINLQEFSESIRTSLEMLTKRSNSNLIIQNNANGISLVSDREKISQVLYNFVDNAVKYGPKNQDIQMTIDLVAPDKVRMSVKGDGQGIDKAMQKKLFLKFSQLEPSLSRSQDGMGLGLYICKQNIEALGGEIGVESEVGHGANFFFTLPLGLKEKASKNKEKVIS